MLVLLNKSLIILPIFNFLLVFAGSAQAGVVEDLKQLQEKTSEQVIEIGSRYQAQAQVEEKRYGEAFAKFLRQKGPYPDESDFNFSKIESQRAKEAQEVYQKSDIERQAILDRFISPNNSDKNITSVSGNSGTSASSSGVSESTIVQPQVSVDGSSFEKELSFPGKQPDPSTERKPSSKK